MNLIRVMPAKGQDVPTSVFIARLIGPVLLAGAIGLFANATAYRAMARTFLDSAPLLFLSGLLIMTAGVAIVLTHNVWVADWPVLITIFGWVVAIAGAVRVILPAQVKTMGEALLRSQTHIMVSGAIWLVVGAVFSFVGYFR